MSQLTLIFVLLGAIVSVLTIFVWWAVRAGKHSTSRTSTMVREKQVEIPLATTKTFVRERDIKREEGDERILSRTRMEAHETEQALKAVVHETRKIDKIVGVESRQTRKGKVDSNVSKEVINESERLNKLKARLAADPSFAEFTVAQDGKNLQHWASPLSVREIAEALLTARSLIACKQGKELEQQGRYEAALLAYGQVMKREPDNVEAKLGCVRVLSKLKPLQAHQSFDQSGDYGWCYRGQDGRSSGMLSSPKRY